jgi:hypothetical protein
MMLRAKSHPKSCECQLTLDRLQMGVVFRRGSAPGVVERDGGLEDALTRTNGVRHEGQVLVKHKRLQQYITAAVTSQVSNS